MRRKDWIITGSVAILISLSGLLCARLFLRNLSFFLQFDPQFSSIFAQIKDAEFQIPILTFLLLTVFVGVLLRLERKQKYNRFVSILCYILLWLFAFISATLLTHVNGICFCDVLISLLDVIKKGGF